MAQSDKMYILHAMKREIITFGGELGSGKSSTADRVAEILGWKRFSSGDFMRALAGERGISLKELSEIAESDPSVDRDIDDKVRTVGKETCIVIDSRLAHHWIPDAFRVYLAIDPKTAAERVYNHMKEKGRISETGTSPDEIYESLRARRQSEFTRYQNYYGIDTHADPDAFDLVLDTSTTGLEEIAQTVVFRYKEWSSE